MQFATTNVPFYRRSGDRSFAGLPIVDKTMMVADPPSFFADGVRPDKLASRLSSGSSGIPLKSYFDKDRIARHRAELVAGYRFLGADPFGTFVHCRPWFQATRRERLSYALRGQHLYSGEQDESSIRSVARWLGRHRGTTIIGLCSLVENLFRGLQAHEISLPPGSVDAVLGVGEPAPSYLVAATPELTGVELAMRYSSTELGLLGFATGQGRPYHLDTSTFHIEILGQDHDRAAGPGEVGRIVVTDLFNRAMPFLRYDTGDLGRFAVDERGEHIPDKLAELHGRRSDNLIGGTAQAPTRASFFKLFMQVDDIHEIRQFQLRQRAIGHFTWTLHAERSSAVEERLLHLMDVEIGDIVDCDFEYVPGIPLSRSGKSRYFISEMNSTESSSAAATG
ncbi:hypothetical protein [Brachybacterium vulturis]|uniref:hypothetical protein n=1 Tax=Brachybacterium vulturis TaxID=2017484 RepID=UPI0037370CA6